MAKKLKSKSRTTSKAKTTEAPKPRLMRGNTPKKIAFHKVSDVLDVIAKHGHSKKLRRQMKAGGHTMTLHPKTVNFIKGFLAKNNLHTDPIGRKAITSDGDYDCG